LINCHTQRTWLYIADDVSDRVNRLNYSLRDAQEAWVGVLCLHGEPKSHLGNTKDRLVCELVEISRGYTFEGDLLSFAREWTLSDRPKLPKGEKYEFINVLWVEWEEGIAYRKAYGRVMKSAWEDQELEWIDLVLG
jgi:hypothetical protein